MTTVGWICIFMVRVVVYRSSRSAQAAAALPPPVKCPQPRLATTARRQISPPRYWLPGRRVIGFNAQFETTWSAEFCKSQSGSRKGWRRSDQTVADQGRVCFRKRAARGKRSRLRLSYRELHPWTMRRAVAIGGHFTPCYNGQSTHEIHHLNRRARLAEAARSSTTDY